MSSTKENIPRTDRCVECSLFVEYYAWRKVVYIVKYKYIPEISVTKCKIEKGQ